MNETDAPRIEELLVHGAWLRGLATRLVGSGGEAEDLVQETWAAALLRGPERSDDLRGWLGRVLRNRAASRLRRTVARQDREQRAARGDALPSTVELAGRAEQSRRLVELVLELPPDPQRIVLLHFFEGLSSAEIARRLERPAPTVRSQLKRGLDQLRERLDVESEGQRERWLSAFAPLVEPRLLALSGAGKLAVVGATLVVLIGGALWTRSVLLGGSSAPTPPGVAVELERDRPVAASDGSARADGAAGAAPAAVLEDTPTVMPERAALSAAASAPVAEAGAPIAGRLIDPGTGEPVRWFELGVLPAERARRLEFDPERAGEVPLLAEMELVRTDPDGGFRTSEPYPPGEYALVPVEEWRLSPALLEFWPPREPSPPLAFEHALDPETVHEFQLATGPVFLIDAPRAVELGTDGFMAVFSYVDHFPPGHFRPARLQTEPELFVRTYPPRQSNWRAKVTSLRLDSVDGTWSDSIELTWPEGFGPHAARFEVEPRALLEVELDYGELRAPPFLELGVWYGVHDLADPSAPPADIPELQASFDGTPLTLGRVLYVPTGTATIGVTAGGFARWFRTVELVPGVNRFRAELQPDSKAEGEIVGRVLQRGPDAPTVPLSVTVSGSLDGVPTFRTQGLEFEPQGGDQVAEFAFSNLAVTEYMLWFAEQGEIGDRASRFKITPNFVDVQPDGELLEFELDSALVETPLVVRAVDAQSGAAIDAFRVQVLQAGIGRLASTADSVDGRAELQLLGDWRESRVWIQADGYALGATVLQDSDATDTGVRAEVRLRPGWGTSLQAVRSEDGAALPGVEVLLDGAYAGVTDSAGQLDLHAPKRPERLELKLTGYRLHSTSGAHTEGAWQEPQSDEPYLRQVFATLEPL